MWVFGYGSLIWGGWENSFDCRQRVSAELPGFRRAFNKPSVRNWGGKGVSMSDAQSRGGARCNVHRRGL